MNPLGTHRGAEQLARLLAGAGPDATGAPTRAAAGNGAMTGQLALVERLRAVAPLLDVAAVPTPAFRTALRTRLLAVAAVPTPVPTTHRFQAAAQWSGGRGVKRRLGVLAGALAGVIALTGTGVAGSRSLPGSPLYGLKRGVEGIELALAASDVAEGTRELQFARTRLREVVALADGAEEVSIGPVLSTGPLVAGRVAFGGRLDARIRANFADMDRETRSGYRLLAGAYRRTSRAELLSRLTGFSTAQQGGLTGVLAFLPAGARPQAQASLALVTVIEINARALLEGRGCPAGCPPPGRPGHPKSRAPSGPSGTQLPAPAHPVPATRKPATSTPAASTPATGAPATRAPIPTEPPSEHSPHRPGARGTRAPGGNGRPPATPRTRPTLPPLPPPGRMRIVPLPALPIPSVLPLPLPVPVLPGPRAHPHPDRFAAALRPDPDRGTRGV